MIELEQVRLRQGDRILFDTDNLRIADGWHLGITGRNGTGKTSLFRLLLGEQETDRGQAHISSKQRLACMAQEVPALDITALDYVLAGDERLQKAQAQLARAEAADNGHAMGDAHALLDKLDAWSAPSRAASLLAGLGFNTTQQQQTVKTFSGGWRMRLNLARTLMANADILLLDEPTNHLDLDAILWLSDILRNYPGTLLLVSHDRHFLDSCVNHILHIEQQRLTHYAGNYSLFEKKRAEQLAQQQQLFDKQEKQRAHLQSFVDRFRAKATKAKQAQSRIKALERLQASAPAHADSGFSFSISAPERLPNPLLTLDSIDCGYQTPLLRDIQLAIEPATRLGLLGANGAGKSTLMLTLAGQLSPLGGERSEAPNLNIGYFHQQQIDQLDLQATPFALMQAAQPTFRELDVRTELGHFGFHGDRAFDCIEGFSGGEKTRLALALLVQKKPAILLLDEPANHLDIEMRDALTLALQDYPGALVMISHDRALLESCVDDYLLVADGSITHWPDDLDAYALFLREQNQTGRQPTTAKPAPDQDARSRRQQAAANRTRLRPIKQKINKLEKQIDTCLQSLNGIETALGQPSIYAAANKQQLQELLAEQANLSQEHEQLEADLLAAMETLETLEKTPES